ncbi:PPOX class F420-dependent oxidoreductase [Nocardia callitridis]
MTNSLGAVATAEYVLLTTFRKDDTPVGTAVWAVSDNDKLYVWTVTDSWKVKRLRRNPAVTLQPCSASGTPKGEQISGTGRLLDLEETRKVRKLLLRKYWFAGPPIIFGSYLRRGKAGTIGIEITAGTH